MKQAAETVTDAMNNSDRAVMQWFRKKTPGWTDKTHRPRQSKPMNQHFPQVNNQVLIWL